MTNRMRSWPALRCRWGMEISQNPVFGSYLSHLSDKATSRQLALRSFVDKCIGNLSPPDRKMLAQLAEPLPRSVIWRKMRK